MKEVVDQGVWLKNEVRSRLAEWVVVRSYSKRRELLKWVEQLPPETRTKALETWEYFEEQRKQSVVSRPGELPPPASRRTGRDTLASSGSHHPVAGFPSFVQ